ncbi:MAG: hypothetical protein LBD40_01805 [Puniceicoccales bacterium]|jgi:hypothetical protein|nr:hypothetical protein [Puniceicoccales bacterium]
MHRHFFSFLLFSVGVCTGLSAVRHDRILSPSEAKEVWEDFSRQEIRPIQVNFSWSSSSQANGPAQGSGRLDLRTTDGIVEGKYFQEDRCKFSYAISSQATEWQEYHSDGSATAVRDSSQPLPEYGGLSLFDLSMPFLHWETVTYLSHGRVLGRPVQRFSLKPNSSQKWQNPTVASVEISLDTAWHIWLKIIYRDTNGKILQYANVLQLRKIGEVGFEESVDFITFPSRKKVRLILQYRADKVTSDPIPSEKKDSSVPIDPISVPHE